MDKMRVLLIKLLYDKVTWWTKNISIHSVIANVTLTKYPKYYLNIILAIRFLNGY